MPIKVSLLIRLWSLLGRLEATKNVNNKAASDKIVREIGLFGKNFENYVAEVEEDIVEEAKKMSVEETDPSKKKKVWTKLK